MSGRRLFQSLGGRSARSAVAFFVWCSLAALAPAQTADFAPREETPEAFPAGAGRDEAFNACTPCHNFKLVAAQGMTRRQWEDSLAWMTERHGMPPLDADERERVLSYLENAFPPSGSSARGGWRSPFAPR